MIQWRKGENRRLQASDAFSANDGSAAKYVLTTMRGIGGMIMSGGLEKMIGVTDGVVFGAVIR